MIEGYPMLVQNVKQPLEEKNGCYLGKTFVCSGTIDGVGIKEEDPLILWF
jgi:hypothetical protein